METIIAQGEDAAVFFELETIAPAAATTLVAEWRQIRDVKIANVRSVFDGRPFEAMFTAKTQIPKGQKRQLGIRGSSRCLPSEKAGTGETNDRLFVAGRDAYMSVLDPKPTIAH